MNTGIFQEIRERVDIVEAAMRYGLHVRHGKALCPFHHDHHPSMSFKDGYYRCWACGAHGDVINLVSLLFGLTPREATFKLNSDFSLGLSSIDANPKQAQLIASNKMRKRGLARWERITFEILVVYIRLLDMKIESLAPQTPNEDWNDEWCKALRERPKVEGLLDAITSDDPRERLSVLQNYREEVQKYAERIARSHQ